MPCRSARSCHNREDGELDGDGLRRRRRNNGSMSQEIGWVKGGNSTHVAVSGTKQEQLSRVAAVN